MPAAIVSAMVPPFAAEPAGWPAKLNDALLGSGLGAVTTFTISVALGELIVICCLADPPPLSSSPTVTLMSCRVPPAVYVWLPVQVLAASWSR